MVPVTVLSISQMLGTLEFSVKCETLMPLGPLLP